MNHPPTMADYFGPRPPLRSPDYLAAVWTALELPEVCDERKATLYAEHEWTGESIEFLAEDAAEKIRHAEAGLPMPPEIIRMGNKYISTWNPLLRLVSSALQGVELSRLGRRNLGLLGTKLGLTSAALKTLRGSDLQQAAHHAAETIRDLPELREAARNAAEALLERLQNAENYAQTFVETAPLATPPPLIATPEITPNAPNGLT